MEVWQTRQPSKLRMEMFASIWLRGYRAQKHQEGQNRVVGIEIIAQTG